MAKDELPQRSTCGFSLVELLVAIAITMIGLLIITQVFSAYEGWRRSTIGVAQTQEGGLLGAFSIEQDLRHVGFGSIKLDCTEIKAYSAVAAQTVTLGLPVTITRDSAGNDKIGVLYSTSPFANIAAKIQLNMLDSMSPLHVDQGLGYSAGDLLVISQPGKYCSVVQVTGSATAAGRPNVTGPGNSWSLPHVAGNAGPWNPPGAGQNVFPNGGYTTGAMVLNLGQLVERHYYVQNSMLRMDERNPADAASLTTYDLIPGVVGLRARIAAGANPPSAVQFSLIVRSGNWEKEEVLHQHEITVDSDTGEEIIAYWPGGPDPYTIRADDKHYRYRVFQTTVPLKNFLWNP